MGVGRKVGRRECLFNLMRENIQDIQIEVKIIWKKLNHTKISGMTNVPGSVLLNQVTMFNFVTISKFTAE